MEILCLLEIVIETFYDLQKPLSELLELPVLHLCLEPELQALLVV